MKCADSRHVTLCDADSRGFIVVAFCSAILHHWMCKIPTEVATLTQARFYVTSLECLAINLVYLCIEVNICPVLYVVIYLQVFYLFFFYLVILTYHLKISLSVR
ncbi:hypothetical protein Psal006b_02889 [Piscirickettsia salmonis]|nr:hypothetical protein Psal006b_02889 [Piscirickettsia salmonis]